MIPTIFVSSTIEDLHHLRESLRDLIVEMGYNPVLSEFGEIGWNPDQSALDACERAVKEASILILIIGRRYGGKPGEGLSPTHRELKSAIQNGRPVYCLVDSRVIDYKAVWDANEAKKRSKLKFPGVDRPADLFEMLNQYTKASANNAYIGFRTVAEARDHIRKQLAHLFGDLLKREYDKVTRDIADVLAEIRTLRHAVEQQPQGNAETLHQYLRATRYLLEDRGRRLYSLLSMFVDSPELLVERILNSNSFADFVAKQGFALHEHQLSELQANRKTYNLSRWQSGGVPNSSSPLSSTPYEIGTLRDQKVCLLTPEVHAYLKEAFEKLLLISKGVIPPDIPRDNEFKKLEP